MLDGAAGIGLGSVTADVLALASADGSVVQTPTGRIVAGVLIQGGPIGGDLTLPSLTNAIGSVGDMAAGGNIAISDATALTIVGDVVAGAGQAASGRSVTISAPGQILTVNGELIGGPGGNVDLSGDTIVIAQQGGLRVPVISADGSVAGERESNRPDGRGHQRR